MKLVILLLIGTTFAVEPTVQPTFNPVELKLPGEDCNSRLPCDTTQGNCRAPFVRTVDGVFGVCCHKAVGDGCSRCRRNSLPMRYFNGSCEACQNSQFKLQYGICSYKY